jgi:hypothetical protein
MDDRPMKQVVRLIALPTSSVLSATLPIPICRSAIVASHTALDHFVAPPIARHDEGKHFRSGSLSISLKRYEETAPAKSS